MQLNPPSRQEQHIHIWNVPDLVYCHLTCDAVDMCKRYVCLCVCVRVFACVCGVVGICCVLGLKSDCADIVSMWWFATGHCGATLDVVPILNVTLNKAHHHLLASVPRATFTPSTLQ